MKVTFSLLASLVLMLSATATQAADKHLFYIHGCCIGKVGGAGYESIVSDLKSSGFDVRFDLRTDESDEDVQAYVAKVAGQVKDLIAKSTPPEKITVAGYSLGSITTLLTASAIANPKVNYVLLAGCPGPSARQFPIDYGKIQGRILSIRDDKDDRFGSCQGKLSDSALQKEVSFDSGKGHSVFRLPDEKYVKLWKEPLMLWSDGKQP